MIELAKMMTVRAITDRKGVTALEYGLIAAAVAVGVIAAFQGLFGAISGKIGDITTGLG